MLMESDAMNIEAGTFVQAKVPDLGNAPIPAKAYYDPEWFELERQAEITRERGLDHEL